MSVFLSLDTLALIGSMSTFPECVLLGDIGGTNARLALATKSVLGPVTSFEVNRFERFTHVVELFLKQDRDRNRLRHALFAIAPPIHGERCVLTNSHWVIDAIELQATFGLQSVAAAPARPYPSALLACRT